MTLIRLNAFLYLDSKLHPSFGTVFLKGVSLMHGVECVKSTGLSICAR